MIRKISTQDVVVKRVAENDTTRRERDYLIERLTRKHTPASIVESPAKTKKHRPNKKVRSGKKWLWLFSPFVLALLVLIVMQFMVSATISVKPKQSTVQVDAKLVASLDATTSPSTLPYQIITLNAMDSETVVAAGTVSAKPKKASGQITIFNNYSAHPPL